MLPSPQVLNFTETQGPEAVKLIQLIWSKVKIAPNGPGSYCLKGNTINQVRKQRICLVSSLFMLSIARKSIKHTQGNPNISHRQTNNLNPGCRVDIIREVMRQCSSWHL
jgi:hypothetical protein